jgi:SagB-type dehydrogenase family enzyme
MKQISFFSVVTVWAILSVFITSAFGDDLKTIHLLKPQFEKGKRLMQALKNRSSSRSFSEEKLPLQVLSNLLWAAFGVNRTDSGKRTAPSARNWQEIDIYVAMAEGLFIYDAKNNLLKQILSEDIRAMTGKQDFVKEAPVNLIYVADLSKMGSASREDKEIYSAADTGFIGQNVYLYCASEGLATVMRGYIDRLALAKTMKLGPDQKVTLAQSVGYPKK